ncbi:MAG: GntR family transcriptional regulator [Dysgonamonadaceae bacterium]|jgi:DNA-binding transcriptional regulator YhcF (GntR family)|nr:GntR family transcriptional regulator [Dysgonamonadaceae bacterium]
MEFKETQAIYLQIGDYVCEQILLGARNEGDRLLSVRELGVALEVNPNTVMRTYDFLQNKEIIFNKRGVGYFVAENAKEKILDYRKKQFMEQDLPLLFKNIHLLGMKWNEIEREYENYLKQYENK